MAVATFTATGTKATTAVKLPTDVFGIEIKNHQLLKDAYLAYMANGRVNLAKALTRGDVSGGGKKPWRQKGTGRARFGSSRNPIWRGGGVAFGPTGNENYSRKLNIKAKRQALRQALTLAAKDKNLIIVEDFAIKDGKTKTAQALLTKLGATQRILLVVNTVSAVTEQALKNLVEVKLITATRLNVFDLMNANDVIFTKAAIDDLITRLGDKS
jgi:large subunit ribosomal protein L4